MAIKLVTEKRAFKLIVAEGNRPAQVIIENNKLYVELGEGAETILFEPVKIKNVDDLMEIEGVVAGILNTPDYCIVDGDCICTYKDANGDAYKAVIVSHKLGYSAQGKHGRVSWEKDYCQVTEYKNDQCVVFNELIKMPITHTNATKAEAEKLLGI